VKEDILLYNNISFFKVYIIFIISNARIICLKIKSIILFFFIYNNIINIVNINICIFFKVIKNRIINITLKVIIFTIKV
jgi:hypothetical protein